MNSYEIMDVDDISAITKAYRESIADRDNPDIFSLGYQWADKPHRHVYSLCDKLEAVSAERDAARAELAAAREKNDEALRNYLNVNARWNDERRRAGKLDADCDALRAELAARDALLLALKVFVERVESGHWQTPTQMKDECVEFRARIDAALVKGGGDE